MLTENREFNEIYEQYKNLILKAAYTYSGSYSAAEDITQDTFLKLYMGYDSMKKKNISSWLFTTAKNAALNYKKKHSREIFEIDENWDSEEDTEKYEAQVKSAEEQFLEDELQKQRLELHEKIFTNLMEKNERWYDAIVLVYYMEMPQAKAAELMGIRLEVLHSLLHRAKKWIKKKYGTEYEEIMKKKNISSWLFTTAKNAALNYKKKHSREIFEIDENWDSEEDTEKYEAQVKSAEEQFLEDELQKQRLELHEKIFTNLMEKNERWYDAIVLVYYMEMPQAKAAELMGIRLEVLHSLLHRAKKWIKKKYGTEYEEMNRED